MTEKQSSSTLCKNITSLDISNHIPFIDHIPLLGTDFHHTSGKSGPYLLVFAPRRRDVAEHLIMLVLASDERSRRRTFDGNLPKHLPLGRRDYRVCLARFSFLISSSEYPFLAIAASLARCRSSSKRFLATPDL